MGPQCLLKVCIDVVILKDDGPQNLSQATSYSQCIADSLTCFLYGQSSIIP